MIACHKRIAIIFHLVNRKEEAMFRKPLRRVEYLISLTLQQPITHLWKWSKQAGGLGRLAGWQAGRWKLKAVSWKLKGVAWRTFGLCPASSPLCASERLWTSLSDHRHLRFVPVMLCRSSFRFVSFHNSVFVIVVFFFDYDLRTNCFGNIHEIKWISLNNCAAYIINILGALALISYYTSIPIRTNC